MSEDTITCPYCGSEWPSDAGIRYCGSCGSGLGPGSGPTADRERRSLCVLFADVSGFTAMAADSDPETVERTMDSLLADLGAVVEAYGGYVDKYLGDAVMGVFGAPDAHEDDPVRAVRAGLEIRDVVADRDRDLSVSVGVNAGEVLWSRIGDGDYTVTGAAVNVAKRLEAAADGGEVVVSERVHTRSDDRVRYDERDPVAVEGVAEPVEAFAATGERTPRPADGSPETPLVAREASLDRLLAAHRAESPAFVAVTGEAGIGKTRLCAAVRNRIDVRESRLAVGQCRRHGDAPLAPFGDVVLSRAGTSRSDPNAGARVVETVREDVAAIDEEARRGTVGALLAVSVGLDVSTTAVDELPPERFAEEAREAWATWFRAVADDGPLVVHCEDLQWASERTRRLCATLSETLADVPVTVVATVRPGGTVPEGFETVALDPFGDEECRRLAREHLTATPTDGLVAFLRESAGGNPYFVAELCRYLRATDRLDRDGETVDVPEADGDAEAVPERLAGLLVGRIDALPPTDRETLKTASTFGVRFWTGVLDDVVDGAVDDSVTRLADGGLVRRRGESTLPDDREYVFDHALLRDAAYDLLPKATRRDLHGDVATSLADRVEGRDVALAARVAHHYDRARDLERAFEWYLRAGDDAADTYAVEEAVDRYERALALARERDDEAAVARACATLADHQETTGAVDAARAAARRGLVAAAAADATVDVDTRRRLRRNLSAARIAQGDLDRGEAAAEQLRALGRHHDDARARTEGLVKLGSTARQQGEYDRARDHLTAARELAADLDDALLADVHHDLGAVAHARGEFDTAREWFEEGLSNYRAVGDRAGEAMALNNLGNVAFQRGTYDRARERYEESLRVKREIGDRHGVATSLMSLGIVHRAVGNYERSRARQEQSLAVYEAVGDPGGAAKCHTNLGVVADYRGDFERAREQYERSLELKREIGDRRGEALTLGNVAEVCRVDGDLETARDRAEESLAINRDIGDRAGEGLALRIRGSIAREEGAHEAAAEDLDRALAIAREGNRETEAASCHLERAKLALEREDPETARNRVAAAAERIEGVEAPFERGRCRRLRGKVAAATGDEGDARDHLAAAVSSFETAGAVDEALHTLESLVEFAGDADDDDAVRTWQRRARDALSDAPTTVADRHREWVADAAAALSDTD